MDNSSKDSFLEKIHGNLLRRTHEAYVYLGYPSWYEVKYENFKKCGFSDYLNTVNNSLEYFWNLYKFQTANHIARVAIYSVEMGDFLGFNTNKYIDSFRIFVDSAMNHDIGKILPELLPIIEKTNGFTDDDLNKIKLHVTASQSFASLNQEISEIIAYHHFWQKKPYTSDQQKEKFPRNQKIEFLSKLLAIIDFHDSSLTRENQRNSLNSNYLTSEEAKKIILKEYGGLSICYFGQDLPEIKTTGEELISQLYFKKIFGKKNPLNPWTNQFSFIHGKNYFDTSFRRLKSIKRNKDIKTKEKKYSELECKINH